MAEPRFKPSKLRLFLHSEALSSQRQLTDEGSFTPPHIVGKKNGVVPAAIRSQQTKAEKPDNYLLKRLLP